MVTTVSFDVVGEKELERVKRVLKETLSINHFFTKRKREKKEDPDTYSDKYAEFIKKNREEVAQGRVTYLT
ncbi:hypothetical protein [Capnocytophaga haemolytica]